MSKENSTKLFYKKDSFIPLDDTRPIGYHLGILENQKMIIATAFTVLSNISSNSYALLIRIENKLQRNKINEWIIRLDSALTGRKAIVRLVQQHKVLLQGSSEGGASPVPSFWQVNRVHQPVLLDPVDRVGETLRKEIA